ncbi:MAG TPA: ABC transporter permease [Gemmatimonadaceae bacterium]
MATVIPALRHTIRRLIRTPAFAIATLLTLSLGIGASVMVFSIVDGVLLRPLPYDNASRLVDLSHEISLSGVNHIDQSDATYLHYRHTSRALSDVGAYRLTTAALGADLGTGSGATISPEHLVAARVSASTFATLRVQPIRGRAFRDEEDEPAAPPVAIIGQRLWERRYAGAASVIGHRVEIDGVPHEIVGIMPARFDFPTSRVDLWLPIGIDPSRTKSAAFDYHAVARLRPGVSLAVATADLQRVLPTAPEEFPGRLTSAAIAQTKMRAVVRPLRDVVVGDIGRVLWVILGAVGFVLLIACANVANLFLVRVDARQRELAVRRALGATRGDLAIEATSEGIVLAVVGGALGLALAAFGIAVTRALDSSVDMPRIAEVGIDPTAAAIAAGITALAALLISIVPVVRTTALSRFAALSETSGSTTAGRRRHRARNALVVVQVAVALVLLSGAGLMARSFARLSAVQPGFDASHAFTFRIAVLETKYPRSGDAARLITRTLDDITALPGVESAGVVTKLPLDDQGRQDTALFVQDRPLRPGTIPNIHQAAFASPGYFRALGIPFLEGHTFEAPDPDLPRRDVIVSRALAERYWPGGHAVGRRVRMIPAGDWYTVIGVTGNVRGTTLEQAPDEMIYQPIVATLALDTTRWTPRDVAVVVRTAQSPELIAARVEDAVRREDPSIPVYAARPMPDVVRHAEARTTFTLGLLAIASAIALVLGAVGIYGVIAYIVSLRTKEIALRLALGARANEVRRMIVRQALVVTLIGICGGILGAIGTTRALASLLFGVTPTDIPTLLGSAVVLVVVAAAASWVPARRAAAVDPALALRSE